MVTGEQLRKIVHKATTATVARMKKEYERRGIKVTIRKPSGKKRAEPEPTLEKPEEAPEAPEYTRSEILSIKSKYNIKGLQRLAKGTGYTAGLAQQALSALPETPYEKTIEMAQRHGMVMESEAKKLEAYKTEIEKGGITRAEAKEYNRRLGLYKERLGEAKTAFKEAETAFESQKHFAELVGKQQKARYKEELKEAKAKATPYAPVIYEKEGKEVAYLGVGIGEISPEYTKRLKEAFRIEAKKQREKAVKEVFKAIEKPVEWRKEVGLPTIKKITPSAIGIGIAKREMMLKAKMGEIIEEKVKPYVKKRVVPKIEKIEKVWGKVTETYKDVTASKIYKQSVKPALQTMAMPFEFGIRVIEKGVGKLPTTEVIEKPLKKWAMKEPKRWEYRTPAYKELMMGIRKVTTGAVAGAYEAIRERPRKIAITTALMYTAGATAISGVRWVGAVAKPYFPTTIKVAGGALKYGLAGTYTGVKAFQIAREPTYFEKGKVIGRAIPEEILPAYVGIKYGMRDLFARRLEQSILLKEIEAPYVARARAVRRLKIGKEVTLEGFRVKTKIKPPTQKDIAKALTKATRQMGIKEIEFKVKKGKIWTAGKEFKLEEVEQQLKAVKTMTRALRAGVRVPYAPPEPKEIPLREVFKTPEELTFAEKFIMKRDYLLFQKMVFGSASQKAQMGKLMKRTIKDIDIASIRGKETTYKVSDYLKKSVKTLKASGGDIFKEGHHVFDIHKLSELTSFPYSMKPVYTPKGVKITSLWEQLARKGVGAFTVGREYRYQKDIQDFVSIIKAQIKWGLGTKAHTEALELFGKAKMTKLTIPTTIKPVGAKPSYYSYAIIKPVYTPALKIPSYIFKTSKIAKVSYPKGYSPSYLPSMPYYKYKPSKIKPYSLYKSPVYKPYKYAPYKPYAYRPYTYKPYKYKPYQYKPYAYKPSPYKYVPYEYKPAPVTTTALAFPLFKRVRKVPKKAKRRRKKEEAYIAGFTARALGLSKKLTKAQARLLPKKIFTPFEIRPMIRVERQLLTGVRG